MIIPSDWHRLADHILSDRESPATVLVHGPAASGKSTLGRYLVHRLLNVFETVSYLDCDPGQAQVTAPGQVALVTVAEPLLSPPFAQYPQHQVQRCVHIGDISPLADIGYYLGAVGACARVAAARCTGPPMVVNTMGWVEGFGSDILSDIVGLVRPDHVVELRPADAVAEARAPPPYRPVTVHQAIGFAARPTARRLTAKDRRTLSLAAAFSPDSDLLTDAAVLADLVAQAPCYRIGFSEVRVRRVGDGATESAAAAAALNGCLVGLVSEESASDPYPQCRALGLIRSVDPVAAHLYVTTRLPFDQLPSITCLMRGSMTIPSALLFQPPSRAWFPPPYAEAQPYSKAAGAVPIQARKNVRR